MLLRSGFILSTVEKEKSKEENKKKTMHSNLLSLSGTLGDISEDRTGSSEVENGSCRSVNVGDY